VQFADDENVNDLGEGEAISPASVSLIDTLYQIGLDKSGEDATGENAIGENAIDENAIDKSGAGEICADENDTDESASDGDATTMTVTRLKEQIIPHLGLYLSTASPDERQLLHFWITNLSGMMIPTQRRDNPFQTIFIPLALSASQAGEIPSGSAALLQAIYALSAFNRAQVSATKEHFLSVGIKHHQKSLQYLRRNLMETDDSQREAVLATIIAMSSIEVIRGTSSTWRIHLSGGRTWLDAVCTEGWAGDYSANVLQQIFLCVEALNTEHRRSAREERVPDDAWPANCGPAQTMTSLESLQTGYILDKVFGITEPIFHSLLRINQLSRRGHPVPAHQLDELERQIRLSDPDALVTEVDQEYDRLTQHHACAFFNACLIHFHRTLRRTAPGRLQRLVQRSLYHLGEIDKLESDMSLRPPLAPLRHRLRSRSLEQAETNVHPPVRQRPPFWHRQHVFCRHRCPRSLAPQGRGRARGGRHLAGRDGQPRPGYSPDVRCSGSSYCTEYSLLDSTGM
jgi:hypothetical protein